MSHEVFEGQSRLHFFRVKSRNGEIVSQSEGYTRHEDAERGYGALLHAVQDDVLKLPTYVLMTKGTELGERVFNDALLFSNPGIAVDRAYDIIAEQGLEVEYSQMEALTKLEDGDTLVLVDIDGEGDVIILKRTTQEV